MDKEYIPARGRCYLCTTRSNPKDPNWEPFHMIGFKDKPQRWSFCNDCFERWMNYAKTKNEGKCPRKKIFKVAAGKEPKPFLVRPVR